MKHLRVVLLFALLMVLFAGDVAGQLIPWRQDRPLVWDDFKGPKRTKRKRAVATAASRIRFNMETDSAGKPFPAVYSYFDCSRSWKKHKKLKPYTLKHEQVHFDIAELNARLLRKKFKSYMAKHADNWQHEKLKSIYAKQYAMFRRYQRKYDRQTKHSRNKMKQEEWNKYISYRLTELDSYRQDSSRLNVLPAFFWR